MHALDAVDDRFREAVKAIDAGDVARLERLLHAHPGLARERLEAPGAWLRDRVGDALDGFFHRPYLLWFVAEDPVRNGTLPPNIAQVARAIVHAARREDGGPVGEQLDYALRLVAWSWIARECGVQRDLIDVLMDAGATPAESIAQDALVNGSFAAAAHLVERGARLTLAAALCLERWDDAARLAPAASPAERETALVLAALHGRAKAAARALAFGADPGAYGAELYAHATPLHHAAASGSLETVELLVRAGADGGARDRAWNATPAEWAEHAAEGAKDAAARARHAKVAAYLRGLAGEKPAAADRVPRGNQGIEPEDS